jgi:hypothetical protein
MLDAKPFETYPACIPLLRIGGTLVPRYLIVVPPAAVMCPRGDSRIPAAVVSRIDIQKLGTASFFLEQVLANERRRSLTGDMFIVEVVQTWETAVG